VIGNDRYNTQIVVNTSGLEKSFGRVKVLAGLDLNVQRGTVLALLRPNGAGKTTTIRILSTLLKPDAGRASVLGYDVVRQPEEVRKVISLARTGTPSTWPPTAARGVSEPSWSG